MAGIDGNWAINVATLAGSRRFDLTLTTVGATLTGTAVGDTGPIAIRDGTVTGDTAAFRLDVVAPLPMSLKLQLTRTGDRLVGTAQAGVLPASSVVGVRMP